MNIDNIIKELNRDGIIGFFETHAFKKTGRRWKILEYKAYEDTHDYYYTPSNVYFDDYENKILKTGKCIKVEIFWKYNITDIIATQKNSVYVWKDIYDENITFSDIHKEIINSLSQCYMTIDGFLLRDTSVIDKNFKYEN